MGVISFIWVIMILSLSSSPTSLSLTTNKTTHISPNSLDDYLHNLSSKSIPNRFYTDVSYDVSLPQNLTGMKVSILRLRSSTLWVRGANFGSFEIPPRIITMPYVKRLEIMYENLGNFSSHVYVLPGFNLLTAVVGLAIYDASNVNVTTSPKRVNIAPMGDPIRVRFDDQVPKGRNLSTLVKCVWFEPSSGLVELSDMKSHNVCLARALGHFALAIPVANSTALSPAPAPTPTLGPAPGPAPVASAIPKKVRRRKLWPWTWWIVGISSGVACFLLAVLVCVFGYRALALRKLERMEKKSEKDASLDSRWIGNSRLPWASMTRTQAINLENDPIP